MSARVDAALAELVAAVRAEVCSTYPYRQLTVDQATERLRAEQDWIDRAAVLRMVRGPAAELQAIKVGGRWRITERSVENYIVLLRLDDLVTRYGRSVRP